MPSLLPHLAALAVGIHRRHGVARRLREDLRASAEEQGLGTDYERVGAPLQKVGKGRIDVVALASPARTSSTICSTVKPCTSMIASVDAALAVEHAKR